MKRLSMVLLFLTLGTFLVVGSAWATAILQIDDLSTQGVDIYLEDTDNDGIIYYAGSVGSWTLTVTTGLTKPLIGDSDFPILDLNSIDVSGGSGTLQITWSDSEFTLPDTIPGFVSEVGGTTDGTVEVESYLDSTLLSQLGPFSGGAFCGSDSAFVNPDDPFSLKIVSTITHTSGEQVTSFDAGISPVPEPATMLLFGVGLCGLAFVGRKKLIRQ